MSTDIPLRCRCGTVRGVALDASATTGLRIFCHCADCQAYARYLEREGGAPVLDRFGGTDIYQMPPSRVRITEGHERLACVRLSSEGMHRWYAGCCHTPIGNTLGPARSVFVGMVHSFFDHASTGRTRDEALGAPRVYMLGHAAIGGCPPHAHPKVPARHIARTVAKLARWLVTGGHSPSPFYDAANRRPAVTPRVLSTAERDALRALVESPPAARHAS